MRLLAVILMLGFSTASFGADFKCFGTASVDGHKSVTVSLKLTEKTVVTGINQYDIIVAEGKYTYGQTASYSIRDGRVVANPVQMIAYSKPINAQYQRKKLLGTSKDGQFETYQLSNGILSTHKNDLLEINRTDDTARLFVGDTFGLSVLKCELK